MNTLPSGTQYAFTGETDTNGESVRVCTGSSMGRRSWRGHDANEPVRCYLRKLKMSACGCYDEQGAYWGQGAPIYWANFDIGDTNEDIFVRATDREDAKAQIREQLPRARFFN